jgi:hypothetical protein
MACMGIFHLLAYMDPIRLSVILVAQIVRSGIHQLGDCPVWNNPMKLNNVVHSSHICRVADDLGLTMGSFYQQGLGFRKLRDSRNIIGSCEVDRDETSRHPPTASGTATRDSWRWANSNIVQVGSVDATNLRHAGCWILFGPFGPHPVQPSVVKEEDGISRARNRIYHLPMEC